MNLTGQQIKDTYEGVLNIGATGLTGSLQTITDGLGNPLPMQVSSTTVNFTGTVTGIVGNTGPAGATGATGAQGPIGPTGAAAPGGSSPITVEQTDSLVSTGVGATGTSNTSIAIGYNSTVQCNDGNIAIGSGSISNSQAGGLPGRATTVIGSYACAVGPGNIALGQNSVACGSDSALAIGNYAKACCDYGIAIGPVVGSSANKGIAIGYGICNCGNSSIAIGNGDGNATTSTSAACAIVIGNTACANAASAIAIGTNAAAPYTNSIAIGNGSIVNGSYNIGYNNVLYNGADAIGFNNVVNGTSLVVGNSNSGAFVETIFGNSNTASGNYNTVLGQGNILSDECSVAVGFRNCNITSGSACVNMIGFCNSTFPGSTGAAIFGFKSVGGTGACDSVVIGNFAQSAGACSVVIGNTACSTSFNQIIIGNNASSDVSGGGNIVIGVGACGRGSDSFYPDRGSISIGTDSDAYWSSVAIGQGAKAPGGTSIAIGQSCASGAGSIAIARTSCAIADFAHAIGYGAVASANCSQAFGLSASSTHAGAVVLGANLSSVIANATHVENLVVFGQAASTAYAIGVTAAVFNVDWNNSNVQTVTLNGSGNITMSNPIDGGVYTLQITQGAGGGHTLIWSNVKWPGGTPPSLSITGGAVDILTFIYGPTAYYGNANLNFS